MRKFFLLVCLLFFTVSFPVSAQDYNCGELYEEWGQCEAAQCSMDSFRAIYWDLIIGGCYLPPFLRY
jgi:hypothetical protein